ncbi:class I adenylate-forming enzyme family protein [Streptantibioticus ferralitis]|uniref:Non-ribosomal peptide synthetase n=1 Tax=Streptantibioticus ferralitis TaxID=236510 RepID=A0ABT5Z9C4_9ACTN|nr:non-ribosomal peptide synthetase [Streptantibioticus ferralitis]MDF2260440.1 non-ribosomal peptide synthetase [Streptantibioticus ferralitis]
MWLGQVVCDGARAFPDRVAARDAARSVNFAELEQRSASLAGVLRALGVERGGRVAVCSANRVEVLEAYFALARLGAAFVPLNPNGVPGDLRAMAASAGARIVMGEAETLTRIGAQESRFETVALDGPWFAEAATGPRPADLPDVEMAELAAVFHTSATTGIPKAVGIDHRHLFTAAMGVHSGTPEADDTVVLVCNPLYHGSMFFALSMLSRGATLVLRRSFTPQGCLAAMESERVTHLWLVPQTLRFLLRARRLRTADIPVLREVVYAAAPMPMELLQEAYARLGCGFRQLYGMTEALLIASLRPQDHDVCDAGAADRIVSVGRPVPGVALEVRDEEGRPLADGRVGEICVRGDSVMHGYLGSPEATGEVLPDGWLRTGDLGRVDAEGRLYLEGRLKDLIIRGGQKITPLEVERFLERHPRVAEAAVIGVPDQDWGEVPTAFVVPEGEGPLDGDEVLRSCVGKLDDHKRPVSVRVVGELPRNPTGKLLRRALRDLLEAAPANAEKVDGHGEEVPTTGSATARRSELVREIGDLLRQIWPEHPEAPLDPAVQLRNLGVSSGQQIAFLSRIEETYGVDWSALDPPVGALGSLGGIADLIAATPAEQRTRRPLGPPSPMS